MPIPVQPARYTSTFDPALEQATQNLLSQKQQRYDTTFGALAEEQARLGEMFFMDENAKQLAMKSFDKRKEDILKQYEGDYGAASKALTNLVVSERNNPLYNLNKLQQNKVNEFQQQINKIGSENAIVVKDPTKDISLFKEDGTLKSISDFEYEIYDGSKIQSKGINYLSQVKPKERKLELDESKKFYKQVQEITQEDFNSVLTNEKIDKFLETTPELRRIAESRGQDPIQFAKDYLRSQAEGLVGVHKIDYLANPDYGKTTTPNPFKTMTTFDDEVTTNPGPYKNIVEKYKESTEKINNESEGTVEKIGKSIINPVADIPNMISRSLGFGNLYNLTREKHSTEEEFLNDPIVRKSIDNAIRKHPELNNKSVEEIINYLDKIDNSYATEFGKISTIDANDWVVSNSDNLFNTEGKLGLLPSGYVEYTAYADGEKDPIIPVGKKEKSKAIYELTGAKDEKDLMEKLDRSRLLGYNFLAGDYPGETISVIPVGKNKNITIKSMSPDEDFQQISSTAWALGHAAVTDNNSDILDRRGNKYGIYKDESDDSYMIPNNIMLGINPQTGDPLEELNGIYPNYMKIKNNIKNGQLEYVISLYNVDKKGNINYIDDVDTDLSQITWLTQQNLLGKKLISKKEIKK